MFGYIYIAGEIDGLHKVGYTAQPQERLLALQRQYGPDIAYAALVFVAGTDMRDVERATHEALGDTRRVTGEWFDLSHGGAEVVTRAVTKRYNGKMLARDEANALSMGYAIPCRDCGVTQRFDPPVTQSYKRRRVTCDKCMAERNAKTSHLGLTVTGERKMTRNDVTRAADAKRNALHVTPVTGVTPVTPTNVTAGQGWRNALHSRAGAALSWALRVIGVTRDPVTPRRDTHADTNGPGR